MPWQGNIEGESLSRLKRSSNEEEAADPMKTGARWAAEILNREKGVESKQIC
jgi:hypothetical protein